MFICIILTVCLLIIYLRLVKILSLIEFYRVIDYYDYLHLNDFKNDFISFIEFYAMLNLQLNFLVDFITAITISSRLIIVCLYL